MKRGSKHTPETIEKLRIASISRGAKPPSRLGAKMPQWFIEATRERMTGSKNHNYNRTFSEEHRKRISLGGIGKNAGDKNPLWKGGITKTSARIRTSRKYLLWRKEVFCRDNYTCKMCGLVGAQLNVDHIKPFAKIIEELKSSTKGDIFEESMNYKPLWDVDNGRTLCVDCHKSTPTYLKNYKKLCKT